MTILCKCFIGLGVQTVLAFTEIKTALYMHGFIPVSGLSRFFISNELPVLPRSDWEPKSMFWLIGFFFLLLLL